MRQSLVLKRPELANFFVSIDEMVFLPIGCFRNFHVFKYDEPFKTFLSSGSTNDSRARHSFSEVGLARYQKAAAANFRDFLDAMGMAKNATLVSLVPPPSEWPQSSLAAMIDMFKREGLNVLYLNEIDAHNLAQDVVVFGTSIHHILAETEPLFDGKNLLVIDTGGTKGRTRNYTLAEIHDKIRHTHTNAASLKIASEYGMCELSSQAYSLNTPHDGWFKANKELTPVIVDLDTRTVMPDGELGFLAFIDENNEDSFNGIITEDLAIMHSDKPRCFKLIGRAPDASQKGCSLNVKANFLPTDASDSDEIIRGDPDVWDEYAKRDLNISMASIGALDVERTREGQRVLMVLSANIPITFVYPTFTCFFRGVKEVHIQLPSNRVNDPTSERVRDQIRTLVKEIAPRVAPMKVVLHASRDIAFGAFKDFDAVLVFGSDETLKTFEEQIAGQTKLIALGSIQNAIYFDDKDADELADLCSRWLGRGCLTPVALVGGGDVTEFARVFAKNFEARVKAAGAENVFAHRHRILEIESRYPKARIYKSTQTFVVDLREQGNDITCEGGGSGLVYVITREQFRKLNLSLHNPEPGFADQHQGKSWGKWI